MFERMLWFILFAWCALVLVNGEKRLVYDYIVVGSGSSGAVVANRLSADPKNKVLLLEAGDRPALVAEVPVLYFFLQSTQYDWNDTVQLPWFPKMGVERSPVHLPQGKALGGTSVINSMMYVRGNQRDFDQWANDGAVGWSWDDVFPYFLKSENNRDPKIAKNGYHGTKGEVDVQFPFFQTPLAKRYLDAAKELGFQEGDVNGKNQGVFMVPQITVKNGRRWGSAEAFIDPIIGRRNFHLLTSAFVRKIIFDEDKIATGVEYDYKGKTKVAYAKKEIILSAGTIRSPQILMLSGIGPSDELKKFDIPVISNLPVGENFQDHPLAGGLIYVVDKKAPCDKLSVTADDYKDFLNGGEGLLASLPSEAIGFVSSKYNQETDWPDTEIVFVTMVPSNYFPKFLNVTDASVRCVALVERPESRGRVTLNSVDPYAHPIIDPNYISCDRDRKILIEGLKTCHSLARTKSMKLVGKPIDDPSFAVCDNMPKYSDAYFNCVVSHTVTTSYHIAGTCKMGNPKDRTTVVDPTLKVKGVRNLRVADASIMPNVVSGHPHAASMMIGEKAADMILQETNSWVAL